MSDKIMIFRKFISESNIQETVKNLAKAINSDRSNRTGSSNELVVCPVLTGSLLFAADLVRQLDGVTEIRPVMYKSYLGTKSSGIVDRVLPFPYYLYEKDVLIVEDIIDSGLTVQTMLEDLQKLDSTHRPASIKVCSLLYKPEAFKGNYRVDYYGFEVGNEFVVGYGMDYDEAGRNLRDIYVLDETNDRQWNSQDDDLGSEFGVFSTTNI